MVISDLRKLSAAKPRHCYVMRVSIHLNFINSKVFKPSNFYIFVMIEIDLQLWKTKIKLARRKLMLPRPANRFQR